MTVPLSLENINGRASKATPKMALYQTALYFQWRNTSNDMVDFSWAEFAIAIEEFVELQCQDSWNS
ncbi:MAG: hypothetical protein ACI9ES_001308 [Oceanospirillaceae bacterium]|jgi:hypothetical protein